MAKSYCEELGEWIRRQKSKPQDKNLNAFLAALGDVREAMETGYTIKTIWANLHDSGRIGFGYDTFRNYVIRFIRQQQAEPATTLPESGPATISGNNNVQPKPDARSKAAAVAKPAAAGFTFNATPKKEDLL